MRLRRPRSRVVAVGSDAGRRPWNTAEVPEIARGLPTGCGGAVTACRRTHPGTALDIISPGAGGRDPRMVSLSAYPRRELSRSH
jgi:hypothetical protein